MRIWLCCSSIWVRALPDADYEEMDTFIMLRRMALLAWMGTHWPVNLACILWNFLRKFSGAVPGI